MKSRSHPFFRKVALSLAAFISATAAASDAGLPVVVEPGVSGHMEMPPRWTLDLTADADASPQQQATEISTRLYGSEYGRISQPLRIETDFSHPVVFAFHVTAVARAGGRLQIEKNGEFFHRETWYGARESRRYIVYFLDLPPGRNTLELQPQAGVVVVDSYRFVESPDELPEESERRHLKRGEPLTIGEREDGYRGIWFVLGQFTEYGDKYSGGLGTYTANHLPMAVYAPVVNKTFFVYGGTPPEEPHLISMASYYDHDRHMVPRPTVVHDHQGVLDPHDNPSINIDDDGYIWVFISGRAHLRMGHIYRSKEPYSVAEFEHVAEKEMTYPQPWYIPGEGFFYLYTKYRPGRYLFWNTTPDGINWTGERQLAGIGGHYQVSNVHQGKVGTFFNMHPGGDVDQRTNIYYAETSDMGQTWTTAAGEPLELPLTTVDNPALVEEFHSKGRRAYTIDLQFDRDGNPLLLYLTTSHQHPGPRGEPRFWKLLRWTGSEWVTRVVCRSDHNYDLGSLYVEEDRWVIVGPTGTGPQVWQTGGEIEKWVSTDQGHTWNRERQITANSRLNHKYVRRPHNARAPFQYYWADGDPTQPSRSHLYFGDFEGRYWKLPYDMEDDYAEPVEKSLESVRSGKGER